MGSQAVPSPRSAPDSSTREVFLAGWCHFNYTFYYVGALYLSWEPLLKLRLWSPPVPAGFLLGPGGCHLGPAKARFDLGEWDRDLWTACRQNLVWVTAVYLDASPGHIVGPHKDSVAPRHHGSTDQKSTFAMPSWVRARSRTKFPQQ